CQQCNTNPWTV
nr:immunoglobulin light chain junction region [Macaca mulatta]